MADENNSSFSSTIGSTTQVGTKKVYLVVSDGQENINDRLRQLLDKAFKLLKQSKAKVATINVQKVLAVSQKFPGFSYIIPEFNGELYEHLKSFEARIYGPLAIIKALTTDSGKIPKTPHPLLALHFLGYNITVTGLNIVERPILFEKIKQLGGIASGAMKADTTYLIARKCDPSSEKYRQAVKNNIPIISPDWIEFVYNAATNGSLSISDDYRIEDYIVPIFAGCNFSTSGFNGDVRMQISQLIVNHGGVFNGNMDRQECTHLVIDSNTGEKYRKALQWGTVKVVTMKWLTKSCNLKARLPEDKYFPGQKTSTQNDQNKTLDDPGVSALFASTQQGNSTTTALTTSILGGNPPFRKAITSAALGSSQTTKISKDKNHPKTSAFNKNASFRRQDSFQAAAAATAMTKLSDPVMDFDMSLFENGYCDFLEDCRLHFFEVTNEQQRAYRRLANCTGCTIAEKLNAGETHIIVPPGNYPETKLTLLKEASEAHVEIVRCEWLIDCVKYQKKLPIEDYIHSCLTIVEEDQTNEEVYRKNIRSSILTFKDLTNSREVRARLSEMSEATTLQRTESFDGEKTIEIVESQTHQTKNGGLKRNASRMESFTEVDDPVMDFDMSLFEDGDSHFLKDCRLYFFEISVEQKQSYLRLANCTGCEIVDKMDDNPTHIILPPKNYSTEKISLLRNAAKNGVEIIRCEWLIDCVKYQEKLAIENYIHPCLKDENGIIPKKRRVETEKEPVVVDLTEEENNQKKKLPIPAQIEKPPFKNHEIINLEDSQVSQIPQTSSPSRPITNVRQNSFDFDEGLNNLSMPITEYISGNRPVKLHLPFTQLRENIPDDSEPNSPTISPTKLAKAIAQMAKNSCPSDSFYEKAMGNQEKDVRDWHDQTIWKQPVDHGFKSPLRRPLFDISCSQNALVNFATSENGGNRNIGNESIFDTGNGKEVENTQKVTEDEAPIRKPSLCKTIPPELLKRCEALSSNSVTDFLSDKNDLLFPSLETRKSAQWADTNVSGRQNQAYANFEADESLNLAPAEVSWEGRYSTQDMLRFNQNTTANLTFNPNTQALAELDVESVDPFSRFSKENFLQQITPNSSKDLEPKNFVVAKPLVTQPVEKIVTKPQTISNSPIPVIEEPPPQPATKKAILQSLVEKVISSLPIEDDVEVIEIIPPKNNPKTQPTKNIPQKITQTTSSKNVGPLKAPLLITSSIQKPNKVAAPLAQNATQTIEDFCNSPNSNFAIKKLISAATSKNPNSAAAAAASKSSSKVQQQQPRASPTVTAPNPAAAANAPAILNQSNNNFNKHVIFTNVESKKRAKLQEQVLAIQGGGSTNLNETTNLPIADIVVCDTLIRSEKLITALACGKIIVPSTYIIACARKDQWLNTDDYEYGNPKSKRKRISMSGYKDSERPIAEMIITSCYRWRINILSMNHGAFYGWNVLLFLLPEQADYYIRIIKAGDGNAKLFTEIQKNEYKNFTMGLASARAPGVLSEIEIKTLNDNEIPFYMEKIIADYLLLPNKDDAFKKNQHGAYHHYLVSRGKK